MSDPQVTFWVSIATLAVTVLLLIATIILVRVTNILSASARRDALLPIRTYLFDIRGVCNQLQMGPSAGIDLRVNLMQLDQLLQHKFLRVVGDGISRKIRDLSNEIRPLLGMLPLSAPARSDEERWAIVTKLAGEVNNALGEPITTYFDAINDAEKVLLRVKPRRGR